MGVRVWRDPLSNVPVIVSGNTIPGPHEPAGEPTHIVCCDPGKALCGADVAGQDIKAVHPGKNADNPCNPCKTCLAADAYGARCAVPKCPGPGPVGA